MRLLLMPLTGCTIGLQTIPGLTDSGYPELSSDTADPDSDGGSSDTGDGNEDCYDNDNDGVDTCSGDCDDADSSTWPGAAPADSSTACMTDGDGDGYGADNPANGVTAGTDCDDTNSNLSPGTTETPFDGVDSNCDGADGGNTVTAQGQSNLPISDNSTVNSSATVSGCSEIIDLLINVNITHTYQGDLTVALNSPGGQSIILHNRTGNNTQNIIGTYAPTGGTLTPAQSLVPLVGTTGNGSWRLTISDNANGDTGTLNSWSIELDCP